MRTITPGHDGRLNAPVTAPGYLLQIDFPTVLRWSNRGDVSFGGNVFAGRSFVVQGPQLNRDAQTTLTVSTPNHDNAIGTVLLTDKLFNRRVQLWSFDGDPDTDGVVSLFDGVGDKCRVGMRECVMQCVLAGQTVVKEPAIRIVRNAVRQTITPSGSRIAWGDELFVLENG